MFVLRTVSFFLILYVVFRPIYGEEPRGPPHVTPVLNDTNSTKITSDPPKNATIKQNGQPKDLAKEIVVSESGASISLNETQVSTEKSTTTGPTSQRVYGGREGEVELHLNATTNVTEKQSLLTNITEKHDIQVTEHAPHEIVPKKGVTFHDTVTKLPAAVSSTTTTTSKPSTALYIKPKKPSVTIGSDEEDQLLLQRSKNISSVKLPTIEYYQASKEHSNKANFVIPIVAVILSVPIVAIILNILYKRGKEWWSHRHYRRMDYLLDGMYNN